MKLSQFTFDITGVSPLMMHNAASMQARDPNALKGAKKDAPNQSLDPSMYIDGDGNLYIPSAAFRNALIAASKGRKIGKTGAAFVIQGSVFPIDDEVALIDPKTKKPIPKTAAIEDRRSAVNNNCKPPALFSGVHCHSPCFCLNHASPIPLRVFRKRCARHFRCKAQSPIKTFGNRRAASLS